MKTFTVMKKTESEPSIMGMGILPFFSCLILLAILIIAVVAARSLIFAVIAVVVFLVFMVTVNYIYNKKVFDRIGDHEQPRKIHNDIY